MISLPLRDRIPLADSLLARKQAVAAAVTEEFFRRHPDWIERYGERGRKLGIEDALFHIDFLAGAIESGSAEPFEQYVRWTTRMLGARGIAPAFVAENLEEIGRALGGALSAAEQEVVNAVIRAGREACIESAPAASQPKEETSLSGARQLFLQAALNGQRKAATNVALEALREAGSVVELYVEVFQASQYEVGRLWETNQISVAQEHLATAITQFVLSQVYAQIQPAEASRGRMLMTGVEGELHQVGANMVSDVLEAEGWDVQFLGTHMPHAGILKAIDEHEAQVLGISATMLFNVPKVRQLVEQVRERFGSDIRIVLGGSAFRFAPSVCEEMGADGFAGDLQSAVDMLCGNPADIDSDLAGS